METIINKVTELLTVWLLLVGLALAVLFLMVGPWVVRQKRGERSMVSPLSSIGEPVSRRLGDLLVAEGLLSEAQLDRALQEQMGSADKLGTVLVRLRMINEDMLVGFLSHQYGIPTLALTQLDIDPEVANLVPADIAKKYQVLPVKRVGNTLTLAMSDPTNALALDDVAFMTDLHVLPVVASQSVIRQAIERAYDGSSPR